MTKPAHGKTAVSLQHGNVVKERALEDPGTVRVGWVHSPRPEYTILIQNAILNSQVLTEAQVRGMVKALVETVNRQIKEVDEEN
jgi:hypothetical protein